MNFIKKIFDLFLFTSFFVSCCAIVMVYQTYTLIIGKSVNIYFAVFVFFSTVCSYNFHWALTPHMLAPSHRFGWNDKHRYYHFVLSSIGLIGAVICFFFIEEHWFYIGIAAIFTFLYSAPKISFSPFLWLKRIAVGKTVFLAMAWTYVTTVLPVLIEGGVTTTAILFCSGQFFLIYAICILFDFRDREEDKAEGIRSMITYFDEKGIDILFSFSVIIFIILDFLLSLYGIKWINIILLIIPAIVLVALYKYSKRNFSDHLYYFVLDGLMMFSGLLLWLVNRF